jgi:hypothetical protein
VLSPMGAQERNRTVAASHRTSSSATAPIAAGVPSVALNTIHLTSARVDSREAALSGTPVRRGSRRNPRGLGPLAGG